MALSSTVGLGSIWTAGIGHHQPSTTDPKTGRSVLHRDTQRCGDVCAREFLLHASQVTSMAAPRSRNALPITEAELRLIANAAIIGDSSHPVNG